MNKRIGYISSPVNFIFDGTTYKGAKGETLASALLANNVHLVGRSFKYHRPRGILTSGSEEPNALVTIVGEGGRHTPNVRATTQEIYDGLVAISQNNFPTLAFDIGEANNVAAKLFPAGFYYKTFMWPKFAWHKLYEPIIRKIAGLGTAPTEPDPDSYANQFAHCDVLVVGGGIAGLMAAKTASEKNPHGKNQSVILCDENDQFGGKAMLQTKTKINGKAAPEFISEIISQLEKNKNVTMLNRTTAFGYFQQNMVALSERVGEHRVKPKTIRERLWQVRANKVVLAQGAIEKPMVFPNNDRPGIMLAGAAATYLHKYGVKVGEKIAIYTACDSAYNVAFDMADAGCEIVAIIDYRENINENLRAQAESLGIKIKQNFRVGDTKGRLRVSQIKICNENGEQSQELAVDCLLMSAGWVPVVNLHSQARGKLEWEGGEGKFLPSTNPQNCESVGSCAGENELTKITNEKTENEYSMQGSLNGKATSGKAFVDFQNDVTASDIKLAVQEGMHSIEHIKRYTTNGMATDQGKLSNMHALAIAASELNKSVMEVGLTTFRPPYTPVSFGTFINYSQGKLFEPNRKTAVDSFARENGAAFEPVGQWQRAWYFAKAGESMHQAVLRECKTVRQCAGMFDASTLGKIEMMGPDCAEFLNLMYTNGGWEKLKVGKAKYGIMLREDGYIYDDGVVARIGEHRYHLTTTTGGAASVLNHMEDYLQTEFPQLKVWLTSITEQYTVIAVQGPKAREVISPFIEGVDIENQNFPHMNVASCKICGIDGRLFRVSFTGELGFEINVPADYGKNVWQTIWARAEKIGACMYGTETMHVLRAEKGYIIVGQDTDGTVTPHDAGLTWAVGKNKKDFVGMRGLQRPDFKNENPQHARRQLVGLEITGEEVLPEGAQIIETENFQAPANMVGFITSSYYSATLNKPFAMALLENGFKRMGETLYVPLKNKVVAVKIRNTIFYDEKGEKLHG